MAIRASRTERELLELRRELLERQRAEHVGRDLEHVA
jgi:hypothetical protein